MHLKEGTNSCCSLYELSGISSETKAKLVAFAKKPAYTENDGWTVKRGTLPKGRVVMFTDVTEHRPGETQYKGNAAKYLVAAIKKFKQDELVVGPSYTSPNENVVTTYFWKFGGRSKPRKKAVK